MPKPVDQIPGVNPPYDPYAAAKKAQRIGPDPSQPRVDWAERHPILQSIADFLSGGATSPHAESGPADMAMAALPLAGAGMKGSAAAFEKFAQNLEAKTAAKMSGLVIQDLPGGWKAVKGSISPGWNVIDPNGQMHPTSLHPMAVTPEKAQEIAIQKLSVQTDPTSVDWNPRAYNPYSYKEYSGRPSAEAPLKPYAGGGTWLSDPHPPRYEPPHRPLLKPIEFDLPAGNDPTSREMRRGRTHYDIPLYHATPSPYFEGDTPSLYRGGDLGFHADPDPEVANRVAKSNKQQIENHPGYWEPARKMNVIKGYGRIYKPLDVPDMGMFRDPHNWEEKLSPVFSPDVYEKADPEARRMLLKLHHEARKYLAKPVEPGKWTEAKTEWWDTLLKTLDEGGYDALRYANHNEGTGGPSYMLTHPSQFRAATAEFDPAKRHLGGLGLAVGGAAVGAAAAQGMPDDKNDMSAVLDYYRKTR